VAPPAVEKKFGVPTKEEKKPEDTKKADQVPEVKKNNNHFDLDHKVQEIKEIPTLIDEPQKKKESKK
jgi:hypothetical protein